MVCKTVSQKLHDLARVSKFNSKKKIRVTIKAFIMSQFSYCPLVWMCYSRILNNKINKLHEKALRLVSDDGQSAFEELLNIDKSATMHRTNLQICKCRIVLSTSLISP